MHIAEDVVKVITSKLKPTTILSWVREFGKLEGYFKRDGRGLHERASIPSEQDLAFELLN